MMNSIYKEKRTKESIGEQTFKFIKNKIKKLIPNLLFAFCIGYIIVYRRAGFDITILLSDNIISEFFQLGILDYNITINSAWWYISSMIFVLILIYPFAKKYKKTFTHLIAPVLILFLIGIIKYNNIAINDPITSTFIFKNGFYKALIFILLGAICYEISNSIKRLTFNKSQKMLITLFEILAYIFLIYNMHNLKAGSIFIAILFTINIAITFSSKSYTTELFRSEKWAKLGQFGFIMFLNNCAIRKFLISRNYNFSYKKMLVIFLILVVLVSITGYILIEIIWKRLKEKKKKVLDK